MAITHLLERVDELLRESQAGREDLDSVRARTRELLAESLRLSAELRSLAQEQRAICEHATSLIGIVSSMPISTPIGRTGLPPRRPEARVPLNGELVA
jgi:hypothetical protein